MKNHKFFYLFVSIIPLLFLTSFIKKYSVDVPFWDQWEFIPLLQKSFEGTLSISDIFIQHNEHRSIFPRLIMLALARLTGWNIIYELWTNIILAIGIFFVLILQINKTLIDLNRKSYWLFPVVSIMIFSLNQAENWLHGWQMHIFLNVFSVSLGTYLLANNYSWSKFLLSILFGFIATFSFATGILYWFVGLWILTITYRNTKKKYIFLIWIIITLINTALFFYNYQLPQSSSVLFNLNYITYVLKFIFVFLGKPITSSTRPEYSLLVGMLGIIVSAFITVYIIKFIKNKTLKLNILIPYLAYNIYTLGSSILTAIGRVASGYDKAIAPRYITITNLFWVSSFILFYIFAQIILGNLKHKIKYNKAMRVIFFTSSVIFIILLTRGTIKSIADFKMYNKRFIEGRLALLSNDKEGLKKIYYSAEMADDKIKFLKIYHLSIFRIKN